jgi:hypothetical protein
MGKIIGGSWDGKGPIDMDYPLPFLADVPVVFPHGSDVAITWPLVQGDEVLIHFASRCIDNWWLQGPDKDGNPVSQIDFRVHDISDCFCVPGPFSQKKKLSGISTTTLQIRSKDGSTYIELDPVGQIINIVAPGGLKITAPTVEIDGSVTVTESIDADGIIASKQDMVYDAGEGSSVSLKSHKHSGVQSGGSQSGPPVPE